MGDITDLYSIRSNSISTTPLKSYVSSYSNTTGSSDQPTGISLSVPNNWYFYVSFQLKSAGSNITATANLKIGSTILQSWSNSNNGGGATLNDEVSMVYKNITGSTATVTLTINSSTGVAGSAGVNAATLISGLFIGIPPSGNPNANITSVICQFSGQASGSPLTGTADGVSQLSSTTTALTVNLSTNPILGAYDAIFATNGGVFAYDFTGTYVSI